MVTSLPSISKITLEDIKFYSTYEMVSMDAQIVDDYEGVTNFYEDKKDLYKVLEYSTIIYKENSIIKNGKKINNML